MCCIGIHCINFYTNALIVMIYMHELIDGILRSNSVLCAELNNVFKSIELYLAKFLPFSSEAETMFYLGKLLSCKSY